MRRWADGRALGLYSTTRNIHSIFSATTVGASRRDDSWRTLNGSMCPVRCPCCLVCHQRLSGDHGAVVGAR
ncbi:hypothetical protein HanIR_Chr09g0447961 [Helianthus annuus]|nr:hypothetical protein HanIR_Chr09g0447961 [Helianthus annuus]